MNEELSNQLSALAAKLGTSAEHLWSVLVRQAYIDGLSSLLTLGICVALIVAAIYAFFHLRRKYGTDENLTFVFYPPPPMDWVLFGMVLLALVAIASNNLFWVISDFFNPEFYAWRQLPFTR